MDRKAPKNPHAVALAQLGAQKRGRARTLAMTPEERHAAASHAAKVRWSKKKKRSKGKALNL